MPRTAETLAGRLRALPIAIEEATWRAGEVPLASYPGGRRPTATVMLRGEGRSGAGESVAWTAAAHERFDVAAVPIGRFALGEWAATVLRTVMEPYERAALEAAAIDLALRQEETTLARLAGVEVRPVRYVVSFEKAEDPVERIAAEPPGIEFKIDADPHWSDDTWSALGATGRVAVLDFKGSGSAADHERAHRGVPRAFLEDPGAGPWPIALARWVSIDIPITSCRALEGLPARPAAVNLKPARMGGVFEALDCAARCAERGIEVYIGGMFEVGVGRAQLAALGGVLCPDAPNDIAPLVPPARPARIDCDATRSGFA